MENGLLYEINDDGLYRVLLPSGLRPIVKPVLAAVIRRLVGSHNERKPEVPVTVVQIEGTKSGQEFPNNDDPKYLKALREWEGSLGAAMLTRFLIDAIVVPEDDDWAWKLRTTMVTIPASGGERAYAFVEEAYPTLVSEDMADTDDKLTYLKAVQQISIPSEAGIKKSTAAVGDDVEGDSTDGPEAADRPLQEQPGA